MKNRVLGKRVTGQTHSHWKVASQIEVASPIEPRGGAGQRQGH